MHFSLTRLVVTVTAALAVLVACGDGKDPLPPTPTPTPVPPTPIVRGEPIGQPVTATVGASGGTVALADGSVTIAIPAGAFSQTTNLTVTPIKNIAPGGIGTGIRIEPANLRFAVPVTVTFKYQQEAADTLDETGQSIAWQDSTGAWFSYINATVTPAIASGRLVGVKGAVPAFLGGAGAVQAPVRRAGDLVRHYYWVPYPRTQDVIELEVGRTQTLSVYTCARERAGATRSLFGPASDAVEEEDLAPLSPNCPLSTRVGTWDVLGVVGGNLLSGTVSSAPYLPQTSRALYTAPDRVPPINPVLVTGSLRWPERNVSRPFTWKIRIVQPAIPLHVKVEFNLRSVQITNSSFFTNAAIYDSVGFDIDLARGTYAGDGVALHNDETKILSGGVPVVLNGFAYCMPPVAVGNFEWATLQSASASSSNEANNSNISFGLKTLRLSRGAKLFIDAGGSCVALEDTPSRSDVIYFGTVVRPDQLPARPGESKVFTFGGGETTWTFTYRQ